MKKLLLLVLVLVIAGGAFLYLRGGSLVQGIIETVGSDVTQVPVTLDGVDLSLGEKKAGLRGLTVGNPAGFETEHAFSVGQVSVSLNSFGGDVVSIKEVLIEAPKVIYEVGTGGSNIDVIAKNVEKFSGSGGSQEPAADDPATDDGGPGTKITIDHVYIRDAEVAVSAALLAGKQVGTKLAEIHLQDIGKDNGGAHAAEVARTILEAITAAVDNGIADLDVDGMLADAQAKLDEAAGEVTKAVDDATKEAAKTIDDATKGATKAVDEAAKEASKALGGLLGGKKKKDG
ncbi:MAG: hypothetical protein AAF628_08890 [Planctomycetota bacterium]